MDEINETAILEDGREVSVVEIALCEQNKIIFKPNQLYRFVVMGDCQDCLELAKVYEKK